MQAINVILSVSLRLVLSLACLCFALLAADKTYATTAAGTVISNQAILTYEDSQTGALIEVVSNVSTISVSEYFSVSVESPIDIGLTDGRSGSFPYRIRNNGNVADRFEFNVTPSGALEVIAIVRDLNRNGIADPGEPALTDAINLGPGEIADVVVLAELSRDTLVGERFDLSASVAGAGGAVESLSQQVTIEAGLELTLHKSVSTGCQVALFPGDEINHNIDVVNTGSTDVGGRLLLLDGERTRGFVVEQALPGGLAFSGFDAAESGRVGRLVIRLVGVPGNSWVSSASWDGASAVKSVGKLYLDGELAPRAQDTLTFTTVVEELNREVALVSTVAGVDLNSDGAADIESNRTCHQFSIPSAADESLAELKFVEPSAEVRNQGGVPDFYTKTDFVTASQFTLSSDTTNGYRAAHEGVYLELTLASDLGESSNIQYDRADQRFIEARIESSSTGDHIVVLLLETDKPGLFRSVAPIELSANRRSNGSYCPAEPTADTVLVPLFQQESSSCVLSSGSSDQLRATYLDTGLGFAVAEASLVNPQALVFNAQTRLPVEGAKITYRLAETGLPVIDRITGLPYQATSDPQGYYLMPRLEAANRYYVDVEPPEAHVFPSTVSAMQLSSYSVVNASYGKLGYAGAGDGSFTLDAEQQITPIDIPLDSNVGDTLLVAEKTALTPDVEVGGVATYAVTVKNLDSRAMSSVTVLDIPPYGFRYVPLSGAIDGETVFDPLINADNDIRFELGGLDAGQSKSLTYSLRLSAAAIDSDGINQAWAKGVTEDNAEVISPVSRVQTKLQRNGVLSDRAALFGKIYIDQNCNAVQDNAEWPVGGVRLYLQDGTYTVSDADGSYSLYGLAPGTHVLKVDAHTLPQGLQLKPIDTGQAVDPESRFVSLIPGDFYRADFAALCPEHSVEQLLTEIKARNSMVNGTWLLKEAERFRAGEELRQINPRNRVKSADGDLSNGLLHGPLADEDGLVIDSVPVEVMRKVVASQAAEEDLLPDPKELVSEITMAQAKAGTWLWPKGDLSVRGRFMAVVRDGIEPTLYVNGNVVPGRHIGERLANRREKAQIIAWYGVELEAGENTLEIKGTGPFGNERLLASGVFKKPSSGVRIAITAEQDSVPADSGRSTLPVKISIVDEFGYPALGAYFVTLENSDGGWLEEDIQRSEPGVQVRVSNGERTVHFITSSSTGEVLLKAKTGDFADELSIQQVSESRPLVAVGLLEGGVSLSGDYFGPFRPSRELRSLGGDMDVDARMALFVKGRVKGRFNLTLSYDSQKNDQTTLMRDVNPSAHYPVHGDASVRGYDAQSRSKLYFKLEEGKNSVMWGDFLTDSGTDHEDLARTRRTLTGFNSVIDSDHGRFRFFASRLEDNHLVEEVPGNGSAMLYRLETYPVVANSEVIELVTRSRENPGIVVARSRLSRFGDYTIDPVLGYVTFSSVIPTLDDQQNPVSIQISYDVESDGNHYLVSGFRFDRSLSENFKLGFSHTSDAHSEQGARRSGAYMTFQAAENTKVSVSLAGSRSTSGDKGEAQRLSIDHKWTGDSRTTFTYARADTEFSNQGASIASGRVESRLNHRHSLSDVTTLTVDALHSGSLVNSEKRTTVGAGLETRIRDWLVRAGLRQVSQQNVSGTDDYMTVILGSNRQIMFGGRPGQINVEVEQDTGQANRRRVQLGAKLQVHEHARVYSNYELSNSLLALAGVSNNQKTEVLTMGVESDVLPQTRMYSEYRMRGAFDSRDYETASGIRADYEIEPGLRVSPNLEVVNGADQGDSIAASVAVSDTRNENSRRQLRLEARHTNNSNYVGVRGSYAARLTKGWTSVLTENLSHQRNDSGRDSLRHSFVASLSRRPKLNNRHHMLFMYNWKEEDNASPGLRRSMHLLSTHQNLQFDNRTVLSGRVGGKHQKNRWSDKVSSDFALLADVRLNFDFTRRLNLDIYGGILATDRLSEVSYSAGAGMYYTLNKNARVGVSYNIGGFSDEDLDSEEYHAQGLRIGLQYKFDEDSLKWLR